MKFNNELYVFVNENKKDIIARNHSNQKMVFMSLKQAEAVAKSQKERFGVDYKIVKYIPDK